MNYRWPVVVTLGMGMLLVSPASPLRADEAAPQNTDSSAPHWGAGNRHDRLGLSEDQKSKLKTLEESERASIKPLWRKQRDLRIKLRDELEDHANDSEIKGTLAAIRSSRQAFEEQAKKFRSEREAVLTPTQQAEMMLHAMKRRWGGHRGWEEKHEEDGGHCRFNSADERSES